MSEQNGSDAPPKDVSLGGTRKRTRRARRALRVPVDEVPRRSASDPAPAPSSRPPTPSHLSSAPPSGMVAELPAVPKAPPVPTETLPRTSDPSLSSASTSRSYPPPPVGDSVLMRGTVRVSSIPPAPAVPAPDVDVVVEEEAPEEETAEDTLTGEPVDAASVVAEVEVDVAEELAQSTSDVPSEETQPEARLEMDSGTELPLEEQTLPGESGVEVPEAAQGEADDDPVEAVTVGAPGRLRDSAPVSEELEIEEVEEEEDLELQEVSGPPAPPPAPPVEATPEAQVADKPPPVPPDEEVPVAAEADAEVEAGEAPPAVPEDAKRARPWFEEFFNDDYLRTVPPPTEAQVAKQCDFIEATLGLEKGATILDVGCGLGLHAVELASRGYLIVGLDLSLPMLSRAADEAQDRGLKMNFLHADMREMSFDGAFDAVLCWGTTFGYFDDDRNREVIERLYRALKPMGLLLLDVVNRDFVLPNQPNLVWFEGDGCVCMEETHFNFFTSRLHVKRTVILDDGRQRESHYTIRLYALHELGQLLHQKGFRVALASGAEATRGVFLGQSSPRLIILAERRMQGGDSRSGAPPEIEDAEELELEEES